MPGDSERMPEPRTAPPVLRIVHGAALELCAQLAAFTSGPARASLESGKPWIRETRRLADRELIARVQRYSLTTYVHLASLAVDIGDEVGLDAFLQQMSDIDPERLLRRVVGADSPMYRDSVDPQDLAMAPGDARARARVRSVLTEGGGADADVDRLLRSDASVLHRDLLGVVADWAERVFPRWGPEAMAAIDRDVDAKAELLTRTSAREFIAAATMGLSFEPGAWVRQVVIAPSVALRPFIVPAEFDATKLFIVSVSDEAMEPDAVVPRRLVNATAALGDAIRMRALHELAPGDGLTAAVLAERLGVERTTLYHHLGILRSAGLVSIADAGDGNWRYQVRRDRIRELGDLLRSYVGDQP